MPGELIGGIGTSAHRWLSLHINLPSAIIMTALKGTLKRKDLTRYDLCGPISQPPLLR